MFMKTPGGTRNLVFAFLAFACGGVSETHFDEPDEPKSEPEPTPVVQGKGGTTPGTGGTSTAGNTSAGTGAAAGTGAGASSAGATAGSGGAAGAPTTSEAGAAGAPTTEPDHEPHLIGQCDPDADGPLEPGYAMGWTVQSGECLRWVDATAKRAPGTPEDLGGDCSEYDHDVGTGAPITYSCGTLTVFPGEGTKTIRLGVGVQASYGTVTSGACSIACSTYDPGVRDRCLGLGEYEETGAECYSSACCEIDSAAGPCANALTCE